MQGKLYSMAQVVKELGVGYFRLYHYEYTGQLPTPKRVGRNRIYTQDDLRMLKAFFKGKRGASENAVR
jgi:DNA-binding transcriptional MerR regulator